MSIPTTSECPKCQELRDEAYDRGKEIERLRAEISTLVDFLNIIAACCCAPDYREQALILLEARNLPSAE